MKEKGVTRFLESLGLSKDVENAQIKELRSINLRSNGNHSIDFRRDRITFDSSKELIKIKEYRCRAVSGLFLDTKAEGNKIYYKTYITNKYYSFRAPSLGDKVFYVNSHNNTLKGTTTTILEITPDYIVVSNPPASSVNNGLTLIGYADPYEFDNASLDLIYKGLLMQYAPKTNFATDVYIDYFAVASFSANAEYFGI